MAGDWIKMRCDLQTHPKVVRMASALNADRLRIVGGLHAVWSLFDAHSSDGQLDGYTTDAIDAILGFPGFAEAMRTVGWLVADGQLIVLPRFDEHNGRSSKRRANETERKRSERSTQAVRSLSASDADSLRTREEKRREEKKEQEATPHAAHDGAPAESSTRFTFKAPEWVPHAEWQAFVEMRRKIRAPLTNHAAKLAVDELEDLAGSGNDPAAVLNQSVMNGWKGLFKLKPKVVAMQPEQREPMRASHKPLTL